MNSFLSHRNFMGVKDSNFNLPNYAVIRRWGKDLLSSPSFLQFFVLIKSFLALPRHLYLMYSSIVSN